MREIKRVDTRGYSTFCAPEDIAIDPRISEEDDSTEETHELSREEKPDFSPEMIIDSVSSQSSSAVEKRMNKGYTHVSSLIKACPREEIFNHIKGKSEYSAVFDPMKIVWAMGREAERFLREKYMSLPNKGGAFGEWSCSCGSKLVKGNHLDISCDKCGTKVDRYGETTAISDRLKVVGHVDLVIDTKDSKVVIECKSINARDFKELTEPKLAHVNQAMWYLKLLKEDGLVLEDGVIITYVCKDYGFKSPYKSFYVKAGDDLYATVETMVGIQEDSALAIKLGRESWDYDRSVVLPERLGGCTKEKPSKCAINCPCYGICMECDD